MWAENGVTSAENRRNSAQKSPFCLAGQPRVSTFLADRQQNRHRSHISSRTRDYGWPIYGSGRDVRVCVEGKQKSFVCQQWHIVCPSRRDIVCPECSGMEGGSVAGSISSNTQTCIYV